MKKKKKEKKKIDFEHYSDSAIREQLVNSYVPELRGGGCGCCWYGGGDGGGGCGYGETTVLRRVV